MVVVVVVMVAAGGGENRECPIIIIKRAILRLVFGSY